MTVPRVFGFGSATLAFELHTAGGARDLLAHDVRGEAGGATANCLVQAARLGMHACWLGKLGEDWIGKQILDQFEEEGVDCSGVVLDAALCSPFHIVTAGDDPRTLRLPNALADLRIDEVEFLADRVDAGEWVVVEIGELPLPMVTAFCNRVKRRDAQVLMTVDLDPIAQLQADPVDLQMLLAQADLLVPNHAAIRPLCDNGNPEIMAADLARRYRCIAVLRTDEGAWYCDGSGLGDELPADPMEPLDPSGGEVAFRGGLLAGLAQGDSLPGALSLAAICASRTAARRGARAGMPRATELDLDGRFGMG